VEIPTHRLAALLSRVSKPARYAGHEWNSIVKPWDEVLVTIALAYPDLYEIGMSNMGLAILYDIVNQRPDMLAERVYAPWEDLEERMRADHLPLFSLETRHTLDDFDVLGFSLQHELNYTNLLNMLDLADIPVRASQRGADLPLVIAGGSCTYNPQPLTDFVDAFVIGEGEQVIIELLECVRDWKHASPKPDKETLLERMATLGGVYVPSLYHRTLSQQGRLCAIEPSGDAPRRIVKRILPRLGPVPTRPIVPTMQTVHDRANIEIQRGCSRGCRFCQAGMIYRPIRERPADEVLQALDKILDNTGHSEVSLVSLSSSDHSGVEEIVTRALSEHQEDGLAISLPSLRIDSFSVRLAKLIQSARKTGFTFAPEAGSQRLRDVINKGVTEEDLVRTAEAAFASGWNRIKLYFMIGLPTETDEDVLEIARLALDIAKLGRAIRGRCININVSVSTFVPKPHTPFQWEPLASRETVERRQALLREHIQGRGLRLSWSDWDATWLEAVLARGDRRLGTAIERAWQMGARFDAWREHFAPKLWRAAFEEQGIDPLKETGRIRDENEVLPWDHIDTGVTRRFLWKERQRALVGELSPDCRETCHACGILGTFAAQQGAVPKATWRCP